jgi:GTP-binding protein
MSSQKLRNVAIIAHVDHGKTTLVDNMIKQTSTEREANNMGNLVMDSMDQERERGITIKAKNASIIYKDYKINIVDTPGHADFGGEVERGLQMVDGALLLVDAQEGPMPQTKYVMKKAIELGLKLVVVINKVDKPAANPARALSLVEDLFLDLGANDEQMDFKTVYASGVQGKSGATPESLENDLTYLLDVVIKEIAEPVVQAIDSADDFQMLVLNLHYDTFKGKMAVGKINRGMVNMGQTLALKQEGKDVSGKVSSILAFTGLQLTEVTESQAGEIVMIAGFDNVTIGDTLTTAKLNQALPRVGIDEPTIQMTFGVNTSPFAGKEGKFTTSRQIRERLFKELETNVALKVTEHPESNEKFVVSGRGELHLSVLIEGMRREGFEIEVSRPQVIFKEIDGQKMEPFEEVEIDVPQEFQGAIMQELGKRGADIKGLAPNAAGTEFHFDAVMPTRTVIGLKSFLLTATKGTVIMHTIFKGFEPKSSVEIKTDHGSIVSTEKGVTTGYALDNAQMRGTLFIGPQVEVYEGMVVGQNSRDDDLDLNPCKEKKLSNMRSKSSDDGVTLTPPKNLSLEEALEYIGDDELLEVTPLSLRIRKRGLRPADRKKNK